MGWTRRSGAASLLLVLDVQRREVGRRIVRLREQKGWGQEDLAHAAEVSVKTISRIENGRHESRNNTVERIAKALDVDKDDLWPKPAPLGLGAEDPYREQLDRIEQALVALRGEVGALRTDVADRTAQVPRQRRQGSSSDS